MTKRIRILHLASFSGNIGDIANHEAFYKQFLPLFNNNEVEIEKLEIRKFYKNWNEMKFDSKFVDYVNTFDLFIFGGGNFFELCWDYSETGTTFDISPELLKQIKTPIFINAIGIDDNKGTSNSNIRKFKLFLETLQKYNKYYFTVRNDGSFDIFRKYFSEYLSMIKVIPDQGFFINNVVEIRGKKSKKKYIGINIAYDMNELRFVDIAYEEFLHVLSEQINLFLSKNKDYMIYLFPHVQADYNAILDLLKMLKNEYIRTRISITSIIQGEELNTFQKYSDCELILAMRFHANVCAISLGIPTIGLITYPKHGAMYGEINLSNRKIEINNKYFSELFEKEFNQLTEHQAKRTQQIEENEKTNQILQKQNKKHLKELKKWLVLNI